MRRLELTYEIKNLTIHYEGKNGDQMSWQEADFRLGEDFTATLRLWKDGIEPEGLMETRQSLERRADAFRIAWRYLGNHRMTFEETDTPTYYFGDEKFPARNPGEISNITDYLRGRAESFTEYYVVRKTVRLSWGGAANIPQRMPFIPQDLHRTAETIVAADELNKYPDLVMKLAYIVLEEFRSNLSKDELEKFAFVRDFVSHAVCDKKQTLVDFVASELMSARISDKAVRFIRHDRDHMAFVSKYAYLALQRAKDLFTEKVKIEGGFLME